MVDWLLEAMPSTGLTPEALTDEHRAIARTVDEFWRRDVAPRLDAIRAHEPGAPRAVLRRAATLGLTAMHVPEAYGGLALDLPSIVVAVEHMAADASYLGWHLGHSGIGTLPLVFFGTDAQKRRYLPRLSRVDLLAAYALTEPQAGSDMRAIAMRAERTADGAAYELTGQKMWITNGGEADLFTVFAQVDGHGLTVFLVEREFGVQSGAEEHKMGLAGTSTTALYFDRVRVPVENVLGGLGDGHRIALSVLNIGRLTMGPLAIGGAKAILDISLRYAADRRASGAAIGTLGAVQALIADAAIRLYAVESATWRAVELVERRAASSSERAAADRHAAECAIVKVAASEMLDAVADAGVQIHGGYGYHRDAFVERAYRDARINRIFEGTNEINRLIIPPLVLKRVEAGAGALLETARHDLASVQTFAAAPPAADDGTIVDRARVITRIMLAAAVGRYGPRLRDCQQVTMAIADGMIDVFVMDACAARARARGASDDDSPMAAMAAVHVRGAMERIASAAGAVLAAVCDPAEARAAQRAVRALAACEPFDVIAARTAVARRLADAGRFVV
jgi:alkylation response protein AidB-like acyl-CoA dehydrogenase